jgi:hypothetical protein
MVPAGSARRHHIERSVCTILSCGPSAIFRRPVVGRVHYSGLGVRLVPPGGRLSRSRRTGNAPPGRPVRHHGFVGWHARDSPSERLPVRTEDRHAPAVWTNVPGFPDALGRPIAKRRRNPRREFTISGNPATAGEPARRPIAQAPCDPARSLTQAQSLARVSSAWSAATLDRERSYDHLAHTAREEPDECKYQARDRPEFCH